MSFDANKARKVGRENQRKRRERLAETAPPKANIFGVVTTPATLLALSPDKSLHDVAKATGMSLSHISRIFNKKRRPSLPVASKIAGYLGISIDRLYGELVA